MGRATLQRRDVEGQTEIRRLDDEESPTFIARPRSNSRAQSADIPEHSPRRVDLARTVGWPKQSESDI
jgi:hypothetical protein